MEIRKIQKGKMARVKSSSLRKTINERKPMENGKIKHLLKDHAYQNIPLTFEEAYNLGVYALKGCNGDQLAQIQSVAALSALHTKATYSWCWSQNAEVHHRGTLPRNAAEQIAGVCAAIFEEDIAKSEFGFCNPDVPYAMDNCGMGGDLTVTANVSTLSAFIAVAAGITMCKHGSPANADGGRHGSSDFISDLGIQTYCHKSITERCVETEGFGYIEALDIRYKRIHLQTHQFAMLPHMNDVIGPITNPLNPKLLTRRLLGVNHLIPPGLFPDVFRILNQRGVTNLQHGIFVRGFTGNDASGGMDELSICEGGTLVAELRDGEAREYRLHARDFGLQTVPVSEISPPNGMSKGEFSLKILKGEIKGSPLSMVLANAALLFYLAEKSTDLKECYAMAEEVQASGKVYEKVQAVRHLLSDREVHTLQAV